MENPLKIQVGYLPACPCQIHSWMGGVVESWNRIKAGDIIFALDGMKCNGIESIEM